MKPFFDIAFRKHLEYGSAMGAVGEEIRPGHFVQERLDFFRSQGVTGFYSGFAGHGGKDVFQHGSFSAGSVGAIELLKKVEKEFCRGALPAKSRDGGDDVGTATEFPYGKAHFIYFAAILFYFLYIINREFHGLGKEEGLPNNTIAQILLFQLFKE